MIVHRQFDQNSLEWLAARAGIPTASELGNLITPKFKLRTGEMVETYIMRKVAEAWRGGPLAGCMTLDMEFGKIMEERAIPWYEFTFNERVDRVGLITTDDGRVGCSPDGLLGDSMGIEIKCLQPQNHLKILLSGEMPDDYAVQVQASMFVTGFAHWKFLSYSDELPKFVTLIDADADNQVIIHDALEMFSERFEASMKKLEALSGQKRPAPSSLRATPKTEYVVGDDLYATA